jgi:cysteine synthase
MTQRAACWVRRCGRFRRCSGSCWQPDAELREHERLVKDIADQIEQVSTDEAVAMVIRLAREEGLFAGTSTGCNVIAALRLAEQLGPDATIVTVMCDTGMKYLREFESLG